jgi:hypothetical protein
MTKSTINDQKDKQRSKHKQWSKDNQWPKDK